MTLQHPCRSTDGLILRRAKQQIPLLLRGRLDPHIGLDESIDGGSLSDTHAQLIQKQGGER